MNNSMIIGKAGELRVMSELLLRGFFPSLMLEISEADIILTNGIRIQVKSSFLHHSKTAKNYYSFSFRGWKRDITGKRKQEKHELKNVDFIILWAIKDNIFFIIPAEKIRRRYSWSIGYAHLSQRKKKSWLLEYENKWDLLSQGR